MLPENSGSIDFVMFYFSIDFIVGRIPVFKVFAPVIKYDEA